MNVITRTIFVLMAATSGVLWLLENGMGSAGCDACTAIRTNSLTVGAGFGAYLIASVLPERFLTRAAIMLVSAHLLLLFSQWRFGAFCLVCTVVFSCALVHAVLRQTLCPSTQSRSWLNSAASGVALALLLLLAVYFVYPMEAPNEVVETQIYEPDLFPVSDFVQSPETESRVRDQPVLVKAYVRNGCGYCREFKDTVVPLILEEPGVPPFTIQYISAPKDRSVPYFEVGRDAPIHIQGLTSVDRFVKALRRAR